MTRSDAGEVGVRGRSLISCQAVWSFCDDAYYDMYVLPSMQWPTLAISDASRLIILPAMVFALRLESGLNISRQVLVG